jgi:transposase
VGRQIVGLDGKVGRLAKASTPVCRLMTAPGIGRSRPGVISPPLTTPAAFDGSRNVGAYLGLTTRRYASGEIDWSGRISKCCDAMLRSYLYEAGEVVSHGEVYQAGACVDVRLGRDASAWHGCPG